MTISVIVPVYKVEPYLRRCVDSILKQTFTDFELILVDDGSPDNCPTICDAYAKSDNRIKVIHKPNGGAASARNVGLDNSIGDFIVFVDSDDWVDSDYLQNLFDTRYDLTISGVVIQRTDNGSTEKPYTPNIYIEDNIDFVTLIKEGSLFGPCCKLFNHKIINTYNVRFPENIRWGEDTMFVVDYVKWVSSIRVIENCDYHYVMYEETRLTNTPSFHMIDYVAVSREYCYDELAKVAPAQRAELERVVSDEILTACSIYIPLLLLSHDSVQKKVKILQHYLENKHVQYLIKKRKDFLRYNFSLRVALGKKRPVSIICTFNVFYGIKKAFKFVYGCMSNTVKNKHHIVRE